MEYVLENRPDKKSRLTIGFLDENGNDEYHGYIMEGICEAARKYDVNVIRFGHFATNVTYKQDFQINMVLEYVKQFNLDGLMFLGWARAVAFVGLESFKEKFSSIPLFSLGSGFDDIPNVYFPGDRYMREILLHLTEVHGFKRIAFIAPFWSDSRGDIYREIMEERGIYDPELYISEKELADLEVPQRGRKAVSILLDDRKVTVEAIVSLFNAETEGVLNELKERGIRVPGDIAVTSYEDGEVGKYFSPSFTTVYFPWKEMGFAACEKFITLLTCGKVPVYTAVPGRMIVRDSCGCMSNFVNIAKDCDMGKADKTLWELEGEELREIADKASERLSNTSLDVEALIKAFLRDMARKSGNSFLCELREQLRKLPTDSHFSSVEKIVSILRNLLLPYVMEDMEDLFLAEDMFQQGQVLVKEKALNLWGNKALQIQKVNQDLEEISQLLIQNFSMQGLIDSLEGNLFRLKIPSCYVFIFDYENKKGNPFERCTLVFEYSNHTLIKSKTAGLCPAPKKLAEVLFPENRPYGMMANLLHVTDEFVGFVLYEPGPTDERVYQALSIHISTALSETILLKELDASYKRLVENAHREGMTNIATGVLHNIRNVLNSIHTSVYLMRDLINASPLEELVKANKLLKKNIGHIEDFVCRDVKGKKLMQFYTKLGEPLTEFQNKLISNIERVDEKAGLINGILIAQQNYESFQSTMEECEIVPIVEDTLKMNLASLQKYEIKIVKNYTENLSVKIQRTKLFHVLMNVIKNAKEAMLEMPEGSRTLTITVEQDGDGKYIRIADTGCGIPEDTMRSIFVYGFTTKKDGHGYGLHSCANYITEMGGKMWAESDGSGKGATFVFQFTNE